MRTFEFWRESETGAVWAVELREGAVVGCCGPLDHSEIDEQFLPTLDYSVDRAAWVDAHRDAFDLYEPAAI
jgi:hypothetical protein